MVSSSSSLPHFRRSSLPFDKGMTNGGTETQNKTSSLNFENFSLGSSGTHLHSIGIDYQQPGAKESRLWMVFNKRIHKNYSEHEKKPLGFKNYMIEQLEAFQGQLEADAPSRAIIKKFIHDLKNKCLKEISQKYFSKGLKHAGHTMITKSSWIV